MCSRQGGHARDKATQADASGGACNGDLLQDAGHRLQHSLVWVLGSRPQLCRTWRAGSSGQRAAGTQRSCRWCGASLPWRCQAGRVRVGGEGRC